MKYAYDISGTDVPFILNFDVDSATAIEEGALVALQNGKAVPYSGTGEILGVAVNGHEEGESETIAVLAGPGTVFNNPAEQYTVSSAGEGNAVFEGLSGHAEDAFTGGYLVMEKANTTLNPSVPVGTVLPITGFTASSQTFAVDAALEAGDVLSIIPPVGFEALGLSADKDFVTYGAKGTAPIQVVATDRKTRSVLVKITTHCFA